MKNFFRCAVVCLLFCMSLSSAAAEQAIGYDDRAGDMRQGGLFDEAAGQFPQLGQQEESIFNSGSKPFAPQRGANPAFPSAGQGASPFGIRSQEEVIRQSQDQKPASPKPKIFLKAEAGDGLASLAWTTSGIHQKPGMVQPKFTIYYGIESGIYKKKIEVGSLTEFKLRGLKNRELYFIKVQVSIKGEDAGDTGGMSADLALSSNEVKVMPLPEEDLGSMLERSFRDKGVTLQDKAETEEFKRDLRQFGYEFFRNRLSGAVSSDAIPVGADYVIGPGDTLKVELWGTIQGRHELSVDRNGEIFVPRVGNVKVWGLNYAQAKDTIDKAISRYFKGYELNVTLGRLRSIQVFVVGEVEMPGTYAITSLGTVVNALSLAGGPSKNGSLRGITVSRSGKVIQEIDLYDMFLAGDRSKDIRLENGDTIFVPVIGPVAAVAGEVRRPGIYELKGKTTLPNLLSMAGGISAAGDQGRVQVERIEGNSSRIILDYEPKGQRFEDSMAGVEMQDRDMVKVFPVQKVFRRVVSLAGNVVRPGEYQLREGMRISDVLPSYEALLPDSYLHAAEIVRLVQPDFHKEAVTFNLQKALEGDPQENLLLHEQDTIRIFSRNEMEEAPAVAINGLVGKPGIYDFYPKMTVRDLVTAAGNIKRNAFLESAELTRVSIVGGGARTIRTNFNLEKALKGDPEHNLALQPDDTVIVRGVVEWAESVDRFVTLAGEVKFPGVYSITKGEKLSSVLKRAGGYTDKAYLKGAKFTRKSVQEIQQKRMNEVIARTENEILQKQGELSSLASSKEELEATKAALEGLMKSLEKLKGIKAEGRVVMRLSSLEELPKGPYDLELTGGDVLEIPQRSNVVNVMGQVYNPTSFVYVANRNVSSYLKSAGGPTRDAEKDDMYVIEADGSVSSRQNSSFGIAWDDHSRSWTFGGFMSRPLEPGDTLVVPQKLERIAWMREIKDITTILSQIALTAGVILAAGL
ncbi:SLBB domain-containing protein [Geobacter sp. DSM 9736]|uniref:SLBB domain-containing protein n=1 Tax=Geobacter sp. DSM 9736 TaxID=1277350 RepID=UPI000B6021DD|nr:SLBB domain-containing protein [Geobacter sp. DSM 9736]SNB45566.1 protein involved in polysaccharide export, contains SLBB domain of the beta-grasp fold [Geobacter sp. DSM 9736]